MVDSTSLAELRKRRFAELPINCGAPLQPGVDEVEKWRDWTALPTSPDQLRIEEYLSALDLGGKRILHIGAGNSGLALRFSDRAKEIVGTTISAAEAAHGAKLGLPNYRVAIHNKYSGDDGAIAGRFDFIVDNNPTTFCCCLEHLAAMLEFYAAHLAPGGQVVTDRVGLSWTVSSPGANRRWGFSFDDLAQMAALAGLCAYRANGYVYLLAREAPRRPPLMARMARFTRSLAKAVARKLRRLVRR